MELYKQQQAFSGGIDGCRDNIILLDAIFRNQYNVHKSLYETMVDMARAFDSVQHSALTAANQAAGLPSDLVATLGEQLHSAVKRGMASGATHREKVTSPGRGFG